ncbi:MAG TPA: FtsX-like permease family protein [Halomonas sp.]|nr:FtsX-like permease family protein [Halomonas sp.]
MNRQGRLSAMLVPRLAAAQLRSDWILTLCLVIALAAVIAPLLVLMGLKQGTIETLRERLVEDPVFREIRPAQTREYAPEWFDALAREPGVGFLTPTILPLSSVLQVLPRGSQQAMVLDLVPTGPGDPLLLENGARIPGDGEVVLSADAARQLSAAQGDRVSVRVTRARGGVSEVVEERLEVVSVLSPRAGQLARLYAPLEYVLDVEAYKEGFAAPLRGWPGTTPEPYLSYDGALLFVEAPLSPIERTGLVINTGIAQLTEATAARVEAMIGREVPDGVTAYGLSTPGTTLKPSQLRALDQKLRGRQRALVPYVSALPLQDADGQPLPLVGRSLSPKAANFLGVEPVPWGAATGKSPSGERLRGFLAPASAGSPDKLEITLEGAAPLTLKLAPVGVTAGERPVVSLELLAALRTGMERPLTLAADGEALAMARGGYRGFRLYADSIDAVPGLVQTLEAQGIEVMAEVEAILRIQVLDAGLARLFGLIALLGISGGTAVLISSLYAAVERLRRDLGVLRLLGLARRHVFFFPVVQGVLIAGMGMGAALMAYWGLATAINLSFADALLPGERFCTLAPSQLLLAVLATLLLAGMASLMAAWRATSIDPAEAIRDH